MLIATALGALQSGKRLQLRYDGFSRVVEVHVIGLAKDGSSVMLVWQVSGGSSSGERVGWKALKLADAIGGSILDEESEAPRPGYRRNNNAIKVALHYL